MSDYVGKLVGRKGNLIAVLVSATVLVLLAVKVDVRLDRVVAQVRAARWSVLLATFAFSACWHIFVGADKWWRILRGLGADVPYGEVLRVRLGSDPIRFASPFKVGEVVNAAYFARIRSFGFSRAAGSIAFDKALNFFGTLFWLYVGIIALTSVPPAGYILLHSVIGAGMVVFLALSPLRELVRRVAAAVHPKIGRLAAGVLSAFEEFSFTRKLGFLAYGVVFQLRPLVVCYLLFVAFRPEHMPSVQEFLAFGSVAVLMSNVPLTVAGIGPREAAIIALFSAHASEATLLSVGVLMSFSIHVIPAIVGVPLMFGLLKAVASSGGQGRTTAAVATDDGVRPAPAPLAVEPSVQTVEE